MAMEVSCEELFEMTLLDLLTIFVVYKFSDFAVGAPYDGPQGSGAVYIYHGSPNGVRTKVSQVPFIFHCIVWQH